MYRYMEILLTDTWLAISVLAWSVRPCTIISIYSVKYRATGTSIPIIFGREAQTGMVCASVWTKARMRYHSVDGR